MRHRSNDSFPVACLTSQKDTILRISSVRYAPYEVRSVGRVYVFLLKWIRINAIDSIRSRGDIFS